MLVAARALLGVAPLCLLMLVPACNSAGHASHAIISDVGSVSEHELNCNCIINFDGAAQTFGGAPASVAFDFPSCLPPDLNTATATPERRAEIEALAHADYQAAIGAYCADRISGVVRRVIGLLDGDACGHFAIECVPLAVSGDRATSDNPACDLPCDMITCDPETNCLADEVIDDDFNIDPERCNCTQATGCGSTSEVFCGRALDTVTEPSGAIRGHPRVERLRPRPVGRAPDWLRALLRRARAAAGRRAPSGFRLRRGHL